MPSLSPWKKASPGETPPGVPAPSNDQSSTNGSESAPAPDGWHLADFHGTTPSPDKARLNTLWRGGRGGLFKLSLWTGLLTLLTLGLYRFWARTRLRRWYWSAIRPGGFPLEYTGTPYEKLLGFLIAVVILAFYIGVINLILLFVSFSLLATPGAAYALTLLGLVPIWFWATYRANRYLLARTRWLGIRFGLAPGAWGYALRATYHWTLTVLTLGLWHPRLSYSLAKYRHDRTWFGSQKLHQGGRRTMLYPAFTHLLIGGFLLFGALIEVGTDFAALGAQVEEGAVPPTLGMLVIAIPWFLYGLIRYGVVARRMLIGELHVGKTRLVPKPRVRRILIITLLGNVARIAAAFALIVAASGLLIGIAMGISGESALDEDPEALFEIATGELPRWLSIAIIALFYFAVALVWNTLTHVFLIMPTWKHYAETLSMTGTGHLPAITQRARDDSEEAGGFAEALDVGAAI